jgi:hypothetical protein
MYLQSTIHLINKGAREQPEVKNATEFTMCLALMRMKIDETNKVTKWLLTSLIIGILAHRKKDKKMNEKTVDPSMCIPVIKPLI